MRSGEALSVGERPRSLVGQTKMQRLVRIEERTRCGPDAGEQAEQKNKARRQIDATLRPRFRADRVTDGLLM